MPPPMPPKPPPPRNKALFTLSLTKTLLRPQGLVGYLLGFWGAPNPRFSWELFIWRSSEGPGIGNKAPLVKAVQGLRYSNSVSSVKCSRQFDAWVHSFTWNHTQVILGEFSTPMTMTFELLGRQWTWNPRRTFAIFFAILSNNLILGNPHPKQGLNISGCLKNHSVDDVSFSKKMISGMAKQFPVSIHVSFVEIKKREFGDPNSPTKKMGSPGDWTSPHISRSPQTLKNSPLP